jgi:hypothetical protein
VKSDYDGWLNHSRPFASGVSIQRGVVQPICGAGANDPRGEWIVFAGIGGAEQKTVVLFSSGANRQEQRG